MNQPDHSAPEYRVPGLCRLLLGLGVALSVGGCAITGVLVPNPHPGSVTRPPQKPLKPESDTASRIPDFSSAFDTAESRQQPPARPPVSIDTSPAPVQPSVSGPLFFIPAATVRVALRTPVEQVILVSSNNMDLRDGRRTMAIQGRISVRSSAGNRAGISVSVAGRPAQGFLLPCTLSSTSATRPITVDSQTFAGAMIFAAAQKRGYFSLVNLLPVEEYLRGVVPLELGKRSDREIEALKAQAVAARTYTYRKISEHRDSTFDLLATVADQVYGGIGRANERCDRAIALTKGKILVFSGEPIFAYYHSTCGGATANIEEVWKKKALPYLVSVSDRDPRGNAWCAASSYSSWTEEWTRESLAAILQKYGPPNALKGSVRPPVRQVKIVSKLRDGRVALLRVSSAAGTAEFGGDAVRLAFRRESPGRPILQSARFELEKTSRYLIIFKGSGYGHGVGMCQMGACGRAQAGQSFEEILQAYYRGTEIVTVVEKKK